MMELRLGIRVGILAAWLGLAATAGAQGFAFSYRSTDNAAPQGIPANGTIPAPSVSLGSSSAVTLIIENQTGALWTLANASTAGKVFQVTSTSNSQVPGGAAVVVNLSFTPITGGLASDNLSIQLVNGGQSANYLFLLTGNGLKANFILSYILNPNGNQVALGSGMPIVFPATTVGSTATATFVISNSGTGTGNINSVTISGTAFQLSGLALLPAKVPPSGDFRFTIAFAPTARGQLTGSMSVDLGDSRLTVPLGGQAVGSTLTFSAQIGGKTVALGAGAGLSLPATDLGSKTSAAVRIDNTGDANAYIATISIVGSDFTLTSVPPLPATLTPGSGFGFTVGFAPQTAGAANGTLIVDNVSIPITSTGVGSSLQFASVTGSANTPVANGGTVVFPNTDIGAKSSISIVISNTGNAPATVSGISTSGTPFSIPSLPALPATIAPGGTLQFLVWFTANAAGTTSGSLQVDSFGVSLKGTGNTPPALAPVSVTGLPQSTSALTQPAIGLSLSKPYPLAVGGTLTLSFNSDSFADDPNIQFATGGRTVPFTIPANTTDALFNGSKQVQFQSGTVAGVITVSAAFTVGSVDITPATPPSQTALVVAGPPQLRNVQVGARTANSIELLITGLSTPRSVSAITLQFTAASGASLQTSSLSINTEAPFGTWFQSATGISFGSQFTASVIVNVNGDPNAVQSVSVTASNSRGDSNALSVNLR